MWYKNVGTTFFRFVRNHAFGRQTDGQTAFSCLDRAACIAVCTFGERPVYRMGHFFQLRLILRDGGVTYNKLGDRPIIGAPKVNFRF